MAAAVISHEGAGARVIRTIALRTVAVALRHGVWVAVVKCAERCGRDGARGFGRAADHAHGAVVAIISAAVVRAAIALVIIRRLIALIVGVALIVTLRLEAIAAAG